MSGEDTHVLIGKIKHSTDQKVPDKKPLVMRPKEDHNEQVFKETPPKKCLVLKPQNDESPISELEKKMIPIKKCLVLKPKDDEPLEIKTDLESVNKKCLVRIPKDNCEPNTLKVSLSIEGKDFEKKNRRCENGTLESDGNRSKVRIDHNNFNGLVFFDLNYNRFH